MVITFQMGRLCVGLGVPTAGIGMLACSIVAVGIGSYAGSTLGEKGGEIIGEIVYENLK